MNADRPFFRTDLVSRPLDDGGRRFIEVTDPDSGTSFKFYEIEYAIACAMDGERDVVELAEWAKIELGLDPSPDELRVVIGTLGDLGYLEGVVSHVTAPQPMPMQRAPAGGGNVTRGWDVQSDEDLVASSAKPTPRMPLQSPVSAPPPATASGPGNVTRGWDVPEAPTGEDFELGFSGRGTEARRGNEPRAAAGEFELGAAGNRGMTDPEAVTFSGAAPDSVHERATAQRSAIDRDDFDEVSTDLSDHIPLGASELKEAVRASQVRDAVKPPPSDEDTQLDAPKVGVGARTVMGWQAPAVPAAAKPHVTVQKQPGAPAASLPAQQQVQGRSAGAPMVLPEKPAEISRPHAAPPMQVPPAGEQYQVEQKSVLIPVLLVVLLLAAVGGVAYWYFVVRPGTEDSASGAATTEPSKTGTAPSTEPTQPVGADGKQPPPPAITAMLEAGPNPEHILTAPRSGRFMWLAPAGTEVAVGAPVGKFEGIQGWERLLTSSQESQRKYQERLDQATSKGDKNAMKAAEDNVKRKQLDIDRANTEMAKYVVAAPLGGVVEPSVEVRVWIKKDTPVAKIQAQSGPRATFTLPAGRTQTSGGEVQVSSKADPTLKATCKVDSTSDEGAGQKIVVTCPTDSGLAAGSEVILK